MIAQTELADAMAAAVRLDLNAFVRKTFKTLNPGDAFSAGWHIEAMCHQLDRVSRGEVRRLLITIPPRHLKSITASVAFPAWAIGHDPSLKFIVASYGGDLASRHARDFRTVIGADWFQFAFPRVGELARSVDGEVVTSANGGRKAVSLGGALTGFGADIIIIDDLMKSTDASSPVERQRVKDFYEQTLLSRLNDKRDGRIVAIQQRLHEDDLAGFLMEKGGFIHLNLPAICEEETEIAIGHNRKKRRLTGEALSSREPRPTLDQLQIEIGRAAFAAQYQQNPVAPEGNLIRWDRVATYDAIPERDECLKLVQSWDVGLTASSTSDFSVCTTWGFHEGCWKLLHVLRIRMEYPDALARVRIERDKWRPDVVLVEDNGPGVAILQELRRDLIGLGPRRTRSSWSPRGYRPLVDKVTRFAAQTAKLESGIARFPSSAPWLGDLKAELMAFPQGRHDDQVDSISQFLDAEASRQPAPPRPSLRF